ncbi:hypothetical protein [Apibacter mensalis]|uniref:hypothetical protein n=1 Tax=Apibacter mensalis TaxID=1586267 RepID=UPI0012E28243|nr:hypothetical protein [Apibacter mensalis]
MITSCNDNRKPQITHFPYRIGENLFTTNSTYYLMNGQDALTKLLNINTGMIVK